MIAEHNLANHAKQNLNDTCVHDWYRFVLAYPDHLVSDMIDYFGIQPGQTVLDPFAGTGTTLVECKKQGIHSTGIDANPVAAFACRVKTKWGINLSEFDEQSGKFMQSLKGALADIFPQSSQQLSFDDLAPPAENVPFSEPLVDVDAIQSLIPKNAISDLPLRKIFLAKQLLDVLPDTPIKELLQLALISVTIKDASNLGFGPEVYVKRKKKEDVDLYAVLKAKIQKIRLDLSLAQEIEEPGKVTVYTGDAREAGKWIRQPVDFMITSPPYPNEKDYTRTTRLELVLFDFIQDRRDLREVKEYMLRSHTRNVFKTDNDSQFVDDIPEIQSLSQKIEQKRIERGATSGFERLYHRVVTEYFGGMYRALAELQQIMLPKSKLALVVGDQMSYFQVPIYTARLLSIVACRKLAYHEIGTLLWRTRLATATRRNVEEHILILERN
ncbi:MAG: DNA methyltransferase [Anaerolineae bacterium]|nr:DNA methyltransferase [Anaerolineae bacterium]